jgi:hypothetical protein
MILRHFMPPPVEPAEAPQKHAHQQNKLGHGRPFFVISGGKTGGGNNGHHLKRSPFDTASMLLRIEAPVVVNPETDSKTASVTVK